MKIFISHSSYDKWVARQISRQLIDAGHKTFLDEKDIKTGDSIDESVHGELATSDEVLILISPTSLKSHWVFIEIGAARALSKRIVPILFHVQPNEIPQPISQLLARDINEIQAYFEELKSRAGGKSKKKKRVSKPTVGKRTDDGFAVGDRVRLVAVEHLTEEDKDKAPKWVASMDKYSGQEAEIIEIGWDAPNPAAAIKLSVDEGEHWWTTRWLIPRS